MAITNDRHNKIQTRQRGEMEKMLATNMRRHLRLDALEWSETSVRGLHRKRTTLSTPLFALQPALHGQSKAAVGALQLALAASLPTGRFHHTESVRDVQVVLDSHSRAHRLRDQLFVVCAARSRLSPPHQLH